MKKGEKKINLEQYLQIYQLSRRSNISRSKLNQIIEMHGFTKLHEERKVRVQECLELVDLIDPTRSTLEESISACAFLSAEQIAVDLEDLGWRECLLVRSIQTLKSEAERDYIIANEDLPFVPGGATSVDVASVPRRRRRRARAPPADFVVVGKRPRSKRKGVSEKALISAAAAAAVVSSVSSSSVAVLDGEDVVPMPPSSPRPKTPPLSPPQENPPPPPSSPASELVYSIQY